MAEKTKIVNNMKMNTPTLNCWLRIPSMLRSNLGEESALANTENNRFNSKLLRSVYIAASLY